MWNEAVFVIVDKKFNRSVNYIYEYHGKHCL